MSISWIWQSFTAVKEYQSAACECWWCGNPAWWEDYSKGILVGREGTRPDQGMRWRDLRSSSPGQKEGRHLCVRETVARVVSSRSTGCYSWWTRRTGPNSRTHGSYKIECEEDTPNCSCSSKQENQAYILTNCLSFKFKNTQRMIEHSPYLPIEQLVKGGVFLVFSFFVVTWHYLPFLYCLVTWIIGFRCTHARGYGFESHVN